MEETTEADLFVSVKNIVDRLEVKGTPNGRVNCDRIQPNFNDYIKSRTARPHTSY